MEKTRNWGSEAVGDRELGKTPGKSDKVPSTDLGRREDKSLQC